MVHSKIFKFGSFCYHIYLPNQLKFWSSRWSALWVRKNWGPFPFQISCVLCPVIQMQIFICFYQGQTEMIWTYQLLWGLLCTQQAVRSIFSKNKSKSLWKRWALYIQTSRGVIFIVLSSFKNRLEKNRLG